MNIGDKAPEILGKDEQGRDIRLSDFKGRKLVLYFYPKEIPVAVQPKLAVCVTVTTNCRELAMRW